MMHTKYLRVEKVLCWTLLFGFLLQVYSGPPLLQKLFNLLATTICMRMCRKLAVFKALLLSIVINRMFRGQGLAGWTPGEVRLHLRIHPSITLHHHLIYIAHAYPILAMYYGGRPKTLAKGL